MNIAKRILIMTGRDGVRPIKGGRMNIAGSIIIVMGAPSGIGAATARELARRGATVVLAARRIAGEMGTSGMYSATKFGLRGLSDSLRRELWTKHIAVSLIEPGYIRTALTAQMKGALPGPEIVALAVARVLERPRRALVVPSSWRLMLLGVRFFPAIADRLLGSEQGQARIHISG